MTDAIRMDEWLAELQRVTHDEGPEGFTTDELAACMDVGHRAAMYHIREWVRERRVAFVGLRKITNTVGRISRVPVYRPMKGATP